MGHQKSIAQISSAPKIHQLHEKFSMKCKAATLTLLETSPVLADATHSYSLNQIFESQNSRRTQPKCMQTNVNRNYVISFRIVFL